MKQLLGLQTRANMVRLLEHNRVAAVMREIVKKHTHHAASRHPHVRKFEKQLSNILSISSLGVESGTAALEFSLRALSIKPGDEVIVPAFSFISTASVVEWVGGSTVFADITTDDYAIDPIAVEKKITPKTRAIIVTHLFGQPATRIEELQTLAHKHQVALIEDCAQSFGAQVVTADTKRMVGGFGDIGCFSFSSTKPFSAAGNAGAVAVANPRIYQKIDSLRYYGFNSETGHYSDLGTCGKLQEIHAATLLEKLRFFNFWENYRGTLAETYFAHLTKTTGLTLPLIQQRTLRTWNYFPILIPQRDKLFEKLKVLAERNSWLHPAIYYDTPLPQLPIFSNTSSHKESFPNSESISKSILSLPLNNYMSMTEAIMVTEIVNNHMKTI